MNENDANALLGNMARGVPSRLIGFGTALDSACVLVDGWPYFLEKPWKWSSEYARWAECGYPQADDSTWPQFMDALDSVAT